MPPSRHEATPYGYTQLLHAEVQLLYAEMGAFKQGGKSAKQQALGEKEREKVAWLARVE